MTTCPTIQQPSRARNWLSTKSRRNKLITRSRLLHVTTLRSFVSMPSTSKALALKTCISLYYQSWCWSWFSVCSRYPRLPWKRRDSLRWACALKAVSFLSRFWRLSYSRRTIAFASSSVIVPQLCAPYHHIQMISFQKQNSLLIIIHAVTAALSFRHRSANLSRWSIRLVPVSITKSWSS